jgi:NADH-quinone oxidoreductase subunit G
MSAKVTINGKEYEANDGELLIDLCHRNGIEIPHFCYHPGLGPDGNCRMCQVEFVTDRGSRLGISCNAVVNDGMEVLTDSENVKKARASVEEMLLLNHPLDCPICDKAGECTLQDYYMAHDLQDGRQDFERHRKEKAKVIGPTIVLDQQRCVLCDRCVRFLRDVAGDEQLHIAGRGHEAYITTFPGKELTSPYSLNTVDLCPVGALTSRDFRFGSATWFLKTTPSVCTSCSRGCSMEIQSKRDQIYRMRPRHNAEVNGYWMCDEGRVNYKFVNGNRIARPTCKRGGEAQPASFDEALAEVRGALGFEPAGTASGPSGTKAVVLVSATCTLEEMYQARRLGGEFIEAPVFAVRHVPDGVDDSLLRRADRHPNTQGAQLLGLGVLDLIGNGDGAAIKKVEDALGTDGTLVCVGFNHDVSAAIEKLASNAARAIALSARTSGVSEAADVVVPGFTFAEKLGMMVNFEGHIQKLGQAIDYAPDFAPTAQRDRNAPRPVSDWKILEDLMASLSGEEAVTCISIIRRKIAQAESAFAGVDLQNVGPTGVRLSGQAAGQGTGS